MTWEWPFLAIMFMLQACMLHVPAYLQLLNPFTIARAKVGCCWFLQCALAARRSPATAASTAPALPCLEVCAMQPVMLGMRAHPLPCASQMGPTAM